MAQRYLAFVCHETDRPPIQSSYRQSQSLPHAFKSPGLTVFSNLPLIPLAGGIGAIVGDLFTREVKPNLIQEMDSRSSQAVRDSAGQHLIDRYWGGYVALIRNVQGVFHVLRDPSAAMPCYQLNQGSLWIFASDAELLVDAGYLVPQVDFEFLAHHLYAPDVRTSQTGLRGLKELMGGFRLSITPETQVLSQVWSPWDYTQPDRTQTDAQLAKQVEDTVLGCVGAWARLYPRSLLGISGGLDSSIVATGLVAAGADLTCFTLATNEAGGDERGFARILRDHLHVPLVEAFHRAELVDFTKALSADLPRPIGHAFGQSNYGIRFELERELGIDAFFSGIGGDNVFCYTQSATALVDRFRAEGLSPGLFQTLSDICRQNDASVGAVLRMAFGRYRNPDPTYHLQGDMTFLGPAAARVAEKALYHPWLRAPKNALPGKGVHVGMLAAIQGTIDGLPRDHAPQILPLLSQPVMEACLSIPMWNWIAGGRNRSVARTAFSERLPKLLVDRQSKGGPNSFAYSVLEQHKDLVRDRLTTGRLAAERLVDIHALAKAMDSRKLISPMDHMRLSDLAECEAWVRHWEARAISPKP